ncbi:3-dehydroquinate synthase [bacterium]|nr:3-dehydroquinate synthase [bacterium]
MTASTTVRVDLGERSYDIVVGAGILSGLGEAAAGLGMGRRAMLISDSNVMPLYGAAVRESFSAAGFTVHEAVFPAGEEHKNLSTVSRLYDAMAEAGLDRRSSVIALGGGVVGDVAGFAAATFLRGLHYLQVPTTLLAQVDSSVGGKTGVDHPRGKNYIGAFHQPRLVGIDLATLATLPAREVRAGLAEVVKYGVIWDAELFARIESCLSQLLALDERALAPIVAECCRIKAEVVSRDERESGLRGILNFGHTLGHALESLTGYRTYLHGEAISIGMVFACRLAERLGMLEPATTARLRALLEQTGLPVEMPAIDADALLVLMRGDKKARDGRLNFILPTRIGAVQLVPEVDEGRVRRTLEDRL